jgi:hypothetical protein
MQRVNDIRLGEDSTAFNVTQHAQRAYVVVTPRPAGNRNTLSRFASPGPSGATVAGRGVRVLLRNVICGRNM